jgi:hypothetical protein
VKAAAGWQASGVTVGQGSAYTLQAEGTWRTAAAGADCSAAGDDTGHGRLQAAVLSESADGFALSDAIPLGTQCTFTAPTDGRLMLRCADDWTQLADNDGEIEVTIRRARP